MPPNLALRQVAEREAKKLELLASRAVEKVALVARRVGTLVQLDPPAVHDPPDIVARREAVGAEFLRELHEVHELHALVAERAGHGSPATGIFVGEMLDHAFAEAAFIIEDVMRDAEPVGDGASIIYVLPRAAGTGALRRLAVVVELQGHADHFGAGPRGERGHDRAVDAAGHGDDDPLLREGRDRGGNRSALELSGGSLPEFHPSELGRRSVGAVEEVWIVAA